VRWAKHEEAQAEIARGADVNAIVAKWSLLDVAIHNNDVAMVDILVRAGADVNQGHVNTGRRPLDSAVCVSDLRILDLLLNAGADVGGCDATSTPLCVAAAFGKREAYDRLIKAGANPRATMHGKMASELLESAESGEGWMRRRLAMDANQKEPDKYEQFVRKMMEEYPAVEEYAAHHARTIHVYGIDQGVFTDPVVGKWARDLGEILRTPERREQCEERFLSADKLDRVRRERGESERRRALDEERKERIVLAAQRFDSIEIDIGPRGETRRPSAAEPA